MTDEQEAIEGMEQMPPLGDAPDPDREDGELDEEPEEEDDSEEPVGDIEE